MQRHRQAICLLFALLLASVVFFTGINWGLPSRQSDRFLYASQSPWSGEKINSLLPTSQDQSLGADVDIDPLVDRTQPIVLNATDAQKAQLIMRYRLYSHQPDEMITFRALSQMKPGQLQLDPKLYQYGGLWTYPVGAMLKLSSLAGWVKIKSDRAFYLDHPEEFGRFYVVARAYSAVWGLLGALTVFFLLQRLKGALVTSTIGSITFIFLPVVVNQAHEAKPHLGGTVLMLMTCAAALRYLQAGKLRNAFLVGALAGCATGMVLSAAVVGVAIPVMLLMRRDSLAERIKHGTFALLAMLIVYSITNPYVPIHLLTNPAALQSNLGNSKAMYHVNNLTDGAWVTLRLLCQGTGFPLFFVGLFASFFIARFRPETRVLLTPAAVVIVQMILLGAGKPAEFGRFGLFADVVIAMCAIMILAPAMRDSAHSRNYEWAIRPTACLVVTILVGTQYVRGFVRDAGDDHSRTRLAAQLQQDLSAGKRQLLLPREPAPYNCPPVDIFKWDILLQPAGGNPEPSMNQRVIFPDESISSLFNLDATISWADKRFVIK